MGFYVIAVLILAVVFGGGYYAYRVALYSPPHDRDHVPSTSDGYYDPYRQKMRQLYHQLKDRPCEYITIRSYDGLTLSGRYYHTRDGAPLDIAFHGYRSSCLTDFSGGSGMSIGMGHNLILVDQRAHGKSEGRTIAFGVQERHDCLRWAQYAVERFGPQVQIMLYGISMGGATVLMAAGLELPVNVKGIVADCPYSSVRDIICRVGRKMGLPEWITWPLVRIGARVYGGFDIAQSDAVEAVKATKIPILIIHGEDDTFVPSEMSDIGKHNPDKITRVTVPGADHGISFLVDEDRYRKTVANFADRVLT